jgi:hypothetical protein
MAGVTPLRGTRGAYADFLLGDDPEAEKQCRRVDFDHLPLAHGKPIVGDGREQLRASAAAA